MRAALLLAALFLALPAAAQPFPKARCAALADRMEEATRSFQRIYTAMDGDQKTHVYETAAPKALVEQGQRTRAARTKYVEALKAYIVSLEDEAYQLRLCAR